MCRSSVNIRLSAIVVSTRWLPNRRKSQLRRLKNRFFRFLRPQKATFRSQITDAFRGALRYPVILSWFASRLSITHQPKQLVENRPNATENRPNATVLRPNATEMRPNATLLRHFVHDAKVHLRRIAFRFLTDSVRVGAHPIHRTVFVVARFKLRWFWVASASFVLLSPVAAGLSRLESKGTLNWTSQ